MLRVTLNTGVDLVAIRVLDLAGRVLRSLPGGSATRYELSVGDLAAGVYLVELRLAGGARVAQRVAVVR